MSEPFEKVERLEMDYDRHPCVDATGDFVRFEDYDRLLAAYRAVVLKNRSAHEILQKMRQDMLQ